MDLDTKMEVNSIDGEKKEATMEVVLEEKSSSPEKMQTQPIPIPPEYPSEFDTRDYPHTVEIRKDKISAKYTGVGNHSNDFGSVRTNKPVPAGIQIYYFEVEIVNAGRQASIAIGFSTKDFPLTRQVGTAKNSTGYRGDDGKKYKDESAGQCYGPFFSTEDVIGCGISSHTNSVFFTKNGRSLSTAFEGVRGVFYPTVSLHSPDEMIRINLGDRPFKYDIEGHRADEKAKFDLMVQNTPVDEACLAPLVREYLAHSGYVNALKTFDEALGSDSEQHMMLTGLLPGGKTLGGSDTKMGASSSSKRVKHCLSGNAPKSRRQKKARAARHAEKSSGSKETNGDFKASKKGKDPFGLSRASDREAIRKLITGGKIGDAVELLRETFPSVIDDNLLFKMHCQQFVELMREGKSDAAIQFARGKLHAYKSLTPDENEHRCSVMGLVAYVDIENSPAAPLLSPSRRQDLAVEINAKIMIHLGLPPQSKLELLLRQLQASQEVLQECNHGMGAPFSLA
mmetsp:Transcript_40936/g.79709  ORF Transcript_40936/g.79709 Transcript_40936/m.79709 type:complete len:510 (-) Transcript_40936:276-1805(-)